MKALKGSKTEQSLKDAFAANPRPTAATFYFAAKGRRGRSERCGLDFPFNRGSETAMRMATSNIWNPSATRRPPADAPFPRQS